MEKKSIFISVKVILETARGESGTLVVHSVDGVLPTLSGGRITRRIPLRKQRWLASSLETGWGVW